MESTYIYSLIDPSTNQVRYIGKSDNPIRRYAGHLHEIKKQKSITHKNNWIKSLIVKNQKPILKVLLKVPFEQWEFIEREMIKHYKQFSSLTNAQDGGAKNNKVISDGTRKKLSESHKGQKAWNKGMKNQYSTSRKGKKMPQELVHKMSERMKGKFIGEKNPFYGKRHSIFTKKVMSNKKKEAVGNKNNFYGKHHSEKTIETLRKASAGKIRFKKSPLASSIFWGVSWNKEKKKWNATISHNNKTIYIGRYNNEADAALAYNKKALELRGYFAILNNV